MCTKKKNKFISIQKSFVCKCQGVSPSPIAVAIITHRRMFFLWICQWDQPVFGKYTVGVRPDALLYIFTMCIFVHFFGVLFWLCALWFPFAVLLFYETTFYLMLHCQLCFLRVIVEWPDFVCLFVVIFTVSMKIRFGLHCRWMLLAIIRFATPLYRFKVCVFSLFLGVLKIDNNNNNEQKNRI